jgi:hypothetical protein
VPKIKEKLNDIIKNKKENSKNGKSEKNKV